MWGRRALAAPARLELDPEQMSDRRLGLIVALSRQRSDGRADLGPGYRLGLPARELEHGSQDLDERRVTRALRIGVAAALDPAQALRQVLAALDLEPRLAEPGLAGYRNHLAAAARQLLDGTAKAFCLGLAPHHRRGEAGDAARAGLERAQAVDPIGGDGLGEALERERLEALGFDELPYEAVGLLADHDAARGGLEPRGEVGDLSRDHELAGGAGRGHRLPGGNAHPQLELHPVVLLEHRVELGEALAHRDRGAHRSLGVVLVHAGHAEDRHDRVARVLLDGAAEGEDLLGHLLEERGEQGADLFGIVAGGQLGGAGEIGEEHRHQLPFVERAHGAHGGPIIAQVPAAWRPRFPRRPCRRLLGRPVSDSGTLCPVDGTQGRCDRLRRSFMLPILKRNVAGGAKRRAPLLIPSIGRPPQSFVFGRSVSGPYGRGILLR